MKKALKGVLPILLLGAFFISHHAQAATCQQLNSNFAGFGAVVSGVDLGCPETGNVITALEINTNLNTLTGTSTLQLHDSDHSVCYDITSQIVGHPVGTTSISISPSFTVSDNASFQGVFRENATCTGLSTSALQLRGSPLTGIPYQIWTIVGGEGDGDLSTHIIRITSPAAYSTTTSPIPIGFDIYTSSTSPPMGYDILFVNSLTFTSYSASGWLVDTGFSSNDYDGVFHVSTSTPLVGDGTWKMTISLWTGGFGGPNPDPVGTQYSYFGHAVTSWFGLNYNDNTQHVLFPPYATFTGYASTSCAINFLGSFSLSDCMGYLFYPGQDSLTAYPSLYATIQEKLPFSYFFSIANVWSSLSASSTENSPTYSLNLRNLGIGSTTPLGNLMPNFDGLSSSTVETYLTPGLLDLLKALAAAALILALFADIFFTVRNMMRH